MIAPRHRTLSTHQVLARPLVASDSTTSHTCSPRVLLPQVHQGQLAVVSKHGPTLIPDAYRDMPYTLAVIKETLRLAQIIPYMPRMATQELPVPGGPTLPAGCPFLVAMAWLPYQPQTRQCGARRAASTQKGVPLAAIVEEESFHSWHALQHVCQYKPHPL